MQLRFEEFDDFIAFFKPNGIRMHQVDDGQFGLVEALSEKLNKALFIVHRLDKATSGIVIFAKSKEAATGLGLLFEDQQIRKTYYFLTDKSLPLDKSNFSVNTHIEKKQNHFLNNANLESNSETSFEFIKPVGDFFLWKALPKTGKPHQIRLHAMHAGIPVLGDDQHQGKKWFRLALHAKDIQFQWKEKAIALSAELPQVFNHQSTSTIKNLFEDCWFKLMQIYSFQDNESFRLTHLDAENIRADVLGKKLWVYDYSAAGLNTDDVQSLQDFAKEKSYDLFIRHMLDRGQGVGGLEKKTLQSSTFDDQWIATEDIQLYQLRSDSGFSAGLFLDQRENRKWTQTHAADKNVLNLFCYTSGFSVAAALGNAKQVTSVDVSKKFLEWSKENFKLNKLDISKHEFFAQDSLLFLNGSIKRNRKWNLIICDPPSFGRSQDSVWKIERDISKLAELLWACLSEKGQILFTCNYEHWSRSDLIRQFTKTLPKNKFEIIRMPFLSFDYQETDELKNLMKGFILKKL